MKILVDMNLSPLWAAFLSDIGFEAVHWTKLGRGDATDREIMAFAAQNDFVVLTHDLDFGSILAATGGSKPSVVQVRSEDLRPSSIGRRVAQALRIAAQDIEAGALLTIDASKIRLRILPFYGRSADPRDP